MQAPAVREEPLDETKAWTLLVALAKRASAGDPISRARGVTLDRAGRVHEVAPELGLICVDPELEGGVRAPVRATPTAQQMLELYLPLCSGEASSRIVFGHVGQSLDAQIATATGESRYVTGPENIRHMHRLRALCDAVIVGASTVDCDDPQLTTRLVPGENPTRVVIDPKLRLPGERRLFQDGAAPTIVICAASCPSRERSVGRAEVLRVPADNGVMDPDRIVEALQNRGLRRIFVEGGGITVSRFLEAQALQRLHVTICPIFIGRGRPGISLPAIDDLEHAMRPRTRRFELGGDVLFDCRIAPVV
jgi:diaminohydroxyphosphoribosylaminopyrimidine deaminase/5-amino-6-(5-phosphoribosylamino)uracil reductase